jgi:hypothetical protein
LRLDPVPPEVADDALEPEPFAIEIGVLRPNLHHCGRLGATDQRQRSWSARLASRVPSQSTSTRLPTRSKVPA